jgi:hypothetical protein
MLPGSAVSLLMADASLSLRPLAAAPLDDYDDGAHAATDWEGRWRSILARI